MNFWKDKYCLFLNFCKYQFLCLQKLIVYSFVNIPRKIKRNLYIRFNSFFVNCCPLWSKPPSNCIFKWSSIVKFIQGLNWTFSKTLNTKDRSIKLFSKSKSKNFTRTRTQSIYKNYNRKFSLLSKTFRNIVNRLKIWILRLCNKLSTWQKMSSKINCWFQQSSTISSQIKNNPFYVVFY